MQALDLIGNQFGRLTVIAAAPKRHPKRRNWLCRCRCGTECEASTGDLRVGNKQSCGCLRRDTCRETGKLSVVRLAGGEAGYRQLKRKYERGALDRGYEFHLTDEQFSTLTKQNCHYCNKTPQQIQYGAGYKEGSKERAAYTYNGIDRKDPTIGYTTDNCVPACSDCNLAKQSLSYSEFLALVQRIYKHHIQETA